LDSSDADVAPPKKKPGREPKASSDIESGDTVTPYLS
jgi:hypothetical protein